MSRYWSAARIADPEVSLALNLFPEAERSALERSLQELRDLTPLAFLRRRLPERVASALLEAAEVDPRRAGAQLERAARRRLVRTLTAWPLPVTGTRGFNFAEVTAVGVPLEEIRLETMESRLHPGLFLCGEICDVDRRIGGYNFQWAWASGFVAGASVIT